MIRPMAAGEPREPKLLDRVREATRVRHLSPKTEKTYVHWIRRYILFHDKRHPQEMGEAEINAFLTHLAVVGRVSASTQTQALCAILFLYRAVLKGEVGELEGLIRARRKRKLPVVLTPDPPPPRRLRHPDRAGAPGAPGCEDHHDLHPRAQPRRPGSAEPGGQALI